MLFHKGLESMDLPSIVIDSGTSMIRAGFAGNDTPTEFFPNVFGEVKSKIPTKAKKNYIGNLALANREEINELVYPVECGLITNWDAMEHIWDYIIFDQIKASEDMSILHSEPIGNPKANREKIVEYMFEKYNCYGTFIEVAGLLALFASGRFPASLVIDVGEFGTQIVEIWHGFTIRQGSYRFNLGGKDITQHLMNTWNVDREKARYLKEQLAELRLADSQGSSLLATQKEFRLPDGNVISIGNERFQCSEILFNPSIIGRQDEGIQHAIVNAIIRCPIDTRSRFFNNIVVCGGCTMIPNFSSRLQHEITKIANKKVEIEIVTLPERLHSVWIGGSVVASLSSYAGIQISRNIYSECGPNVVHRKCLYLT